MFEEKISELNSSNAFAFQYGSEGEKRVYTVDEIQDILGVSRTTTYRLIKSGVFHSVRVGGQHRISKKSFDSWLDNPSGVNGNSQVCD